MVFPFESRGERLDFGEVMVANELLPLEVQLGHEG